MSDLINHITLAAGFNTAEKVASYLQISVRTWRRTLASGRIKRAQIDALRYRAGFLPPGENSHFKGWRVSDDRIITRSGASAHYNQVEQIDWYRALVNELVSDYEALKNADDSRRRSCEDLFLLGKTG